MSNPSISKARERYLLQRFIDASNIPASIAGEGEAPDFEIQVGDNRIGVEVTELFLSDNSGQSPLKAFEAITSKIVASAKSEYEQRGGQPLHVSVTFFSGIDIRQVQRNQASLALANLICDLPKSPDQHTTWSNDYRCPIGLECVAFVLILVVPDKHIAHWGVGQAGWVAPLTEDSIQKRVSAKNNLLSRYRLNHKENWLIVAVDGGTPSQFFNVDELPHPIIVPHDFDQAHFFRAFPTCIIPICSP